MKRLLCLASFAACLFAQGPSFIPFPQPTTPSGGFVGGASNIGTANAVDCSVSSGVIGECNGAGPFTFGNLSMVNPSALTTLNLIGGSSLITAGQGLGTVAYGGSGITATGTVNQTCLLTSFNNGNVGGTATITLTGTNTIALFHAATVTNPGSGNTSASSTATAGSGTATCSGTASVLATLAGFSTTLTATGTTNSTLPAGTHSLAPLDAPIFSGIPILAQHNLVGSGGNIVSEATNNMSILGGCSASGGVYTAIGTDCGQIHLSGIAMEFFLDSGLTPGNTFTPTRRGYFSGSQWLLANGSVGTPSLAGQNFSTTGFQWTGDPGINLSISGATAFRFLPNEFIIGSPVSPGATLDVAGAPGANTGNFKIVGNRTAYGDITGQWLTTAAGGANSDNVKISVDSGFIQIVPANSYIMFGGATASFPAWTWTSQTNPILTLGDGARGTTAVLAIPGSAGAANTVACYKTGGVIGWASNTAGVIGTTCN